MRPGIWVMDNQQFFLPILTTNRLFSVLLCQILQLRMILFFRLRQYYTVIIIQLYVFLGTVIYCICYVDLQKSHVLFFLPDRTHQS